MDPVIGGALIGGGASLGGALIGARGASQNTQQALWQQLMMHKADQEL